MEYTSSKLKTEISNDKDFILKAAVYDVNVLRYASPELQNDPEIIAAKIAAKK